MIPIKINEENLLQFLKNIRQEDKLELEYFYKDNIEHEFIKTVFENKNTYFLADKSNNPCAIGGVSTIFKNKVKLGQVWLLSAELNLRDKIFLYKYIKSKIDLFKKDDDILFNFIYKSNFEALKWLKKCGFSAINLSCRDFKLFYLKKGEPNFDIRYITC